MNSNPDAFVEEVWHTRLEITRQEVGQSETGQPAFELTQADRHERIARRAYALYQSRGSADGWDVQDWLDAERQINADSGPFES